MRMRVFCGVKMADCTDSRTMQEVVDLCNGAVSEKNPQLFWPSLPVEYITSISGWTDAWEGDVEWTHRQTDPTTVTLTAHAHRGLIRQPNINFIHSTEKQFASFKPNNMEDWGLVTAILVTGSIYVHVCIDQKDYPKTSHRHVQCTNICKQHPQSC